MEKIKYKTQNVPIPRLVREDDNECINEQCQRIKKNSVTNAIKDLYQSVKIEARYGWMKMEKYFAKVKELKSDGSSIAVICIKKKASLTCHSQTSQIP